VEVEALLSWGGCGFWEEGRWVARGVDAAVFLGLGCVWGGCWVDWIWKGWGFWVDGYCN